MTSPFAKPSDYAGNSFFKPKEHQTDLAVLLEPISIERNVQSTYQGKTRHRDEVLANITIFANTEALLNGTPSKEYKNTKVVHGMLTSTLEKILGGAMVATVTTTPTENGNGYVFRDVDAETEEKVGAYYANREAAVSEALANVPDF